jgi:hypothetical protein
MRIIKRGTLVEELIAVWDCKYCKSKIESYWREGTNYEDRNESGVNFSCPLCGCGNRVGRHKFFSRNQMSQLEREKCY